MTDEKRFHRRANFLIGAYVLCLALFTGILYNAQIVNGSEYLARSTIQVTTTKTVETSRGIITDRNGKILVSNREIYTVSFDPDLVPDQDGETHQAAVARALLRILTLFQDHGVAWGDSLPIATVEPYGYAFAGATGAQRAWFSHYLADRKWSSTELTASSSSPLMSQTLLDKLKLTGSTALTAPHLLELMRADFGVPTDFSRQEARLVLGVLYELRLRKLTANAVTVPYVFAEDLSVELISILNDGAFEGVVIGSKAVRQYNTDYAAHILGRVGKFESREERDGFNAEWNAAREAGEDTTGLPYYRLDDQVGKDGVELAFEQYLRGRDGTRLITTNQEGKITSEIYSIQPEPGGTVALTLDIDFQAQVEEILARSVQAMDQEDLEDGEEPVNRGAAAAVVSVANSEILALATYPTYSQRTYAQDYALLSQDPRHPYVNRAISSAYAPGSTFKPLTAVAALESGVITPTTIINATGSWTYPGDPNSYANCWLYNSSRGRHGRINVSQAITVSCNYFFAQMGYSLGLDRLNAYCRAFGLGESTGIEIYERTGTLPENKPGEDQSPWAGFGQSSQLFTPLQLANYVATLVRGGTRYNAHLLKDISAYDGSSVLYTAQPEVLSQQEIQPDNLAAVKKGMGDLATTGSVGQQFANCIVTAGAKTGSAQTGEVMANGVFVCFAPFEEPEVAVAVVIEKGKAGAALASTAVEILNAYFAPSDIGAMMAPEGALLP
ncbi:MAG: penicillin-binding protein A [Oscillospiraceae bacterium]|jgi:penicillin-binding protein 2|nr:penicillin-binding protein A [Oscillospiraceae bacterium]